MRFFKMFSCKVIMLFLFVALMAFQTEMPAAEQQTTGQPGSTSSTTTIDSKYLPSPSQPFKGVINFNANQSTPYWPATVVPSRKTLPTSY